MALALITIRRRSTRLLLCNPITKEFVELPQPPIPIYHIDGVACDFFEHDLQSSTYKIFLACNSSMYTYNSSSQVWQILDSFSSLKSSIYLEVKFFSCITYKNNIYVAFSTSKHKLMIVVYNPTNDVWIEVYLNIMNDKSSKDFLNRRFIIVDGRLFYIQVCNWKLSTINCIVSIWEMKIEDRFLIPITKIISPYMMHCNSEHYSLEHVSQANFKFHVYNKIIILQYKKDVGITYIIHTNGHIDIGRYYGFGIHPFKLTLVSPKCRQI